MMTAEERYRNDPVFKAMVNVFEMYITTAQVTPSEVREAAVLACIHYEQKTVRPVIVRTGERNADA